MSAASNWSKSTPLIDTFFERPNRDIIDAYLVLDSRSKVVPKMKFSGMSSFMYLNTVMKYLDVMELKEEHHAYTLEVIASLIRSRNKLGKISDFFVNDAEFTSSVDLRTALVRWNQNMGMLPSASSVSSNVLDWMRNVFIHMPTNPYVRLYTQEVLPHVSVSALPVCFDYSPALILIRQGVVDLLFVASVFRNANTSAMGKLFWPLARQLIHIRVEAPFGLQNFFNENFLWGQIILCLDDTSYNMSHSLRIRKPVSIVRLSNYPGVKPTIHVTEKLFFYDNFSIHGINVIYCGPMRSSGVSLSVRTVKDNNKKPNQIFECGNCDFTLGGIEAIGTASVVLRNVNVSFTPIAIECVEVKNLTITGNFPFNSFNEIKILAKLDRCESVAFKDILLCQVKTVICGSKLHRLTFEHVSAVDCGILGLKTVESNAFSVVNCEGKIFADILRLPAVQEKFYTDYKQRDRKNKRKRHSPHKNTPSRRQKVLVETKASVLFDQSYNSAVHRLDFSESKSETVLPDSGAKQEPTPTLVCDPEPTQTLVCDPAAPFDLVNAKPDEDFLEYFHRERSPDLLQSQSFESFLNEAETTDWHKF